MMSRTIYNLCFSIVILFSVALISPLANAAENWKGTTQTSPIELGTMGGMALYGSSAHWSWLGTAAYLIQPNGWIDDIDERIWAEIQIGPTFFSQNAVSSTGMQYSAHLRWDFTYNQDWTFYALGGLGGFYLPTNLGGNGVKGYPTIAPRFGVGAEFQTKLPMMFRVELSHEFIGAGVAFNF